MAGYVPSSMSSFPTGVMAAGIPLFGADDLVTPGKVFWVDPTYGSDLGNSGEAKDDAKLTLSGANDACTANAYDIVMVLPGTLTQTALLTPKAGVKFRAAVIRPYPTVTITGSIATFFTLAANNIVFDGFRILAAADAVNNFFLIADTVDVYGFGLYRCLLDPNTKASVVAINATDAVYGMKFAHIIGNHFRFGFDTNTIGIGALGMTGSKILVNTICVTDGVTGITLADTGAITVGAEAEIAYNLFMGNDITPDDLAITILGTENATALVAIHDNRSTYLAAAAASQDKISLAEVNNYGGDAATGGTLWDPGT